MATWLKIQFSDQWANALDENASGYVIKCYIAGTTTPTPMAIDSSGSTTVATATLNADGFAEVSGNEVALYIDRDYKYAIYENAADAAADTNAFYGPIDNVKYKDLVDVTVNGLSQTVEEFANKLQVADYAALRAGLTAGDYAAGDFVTITDSRTGGVFAITAGSTDDGGVNISDGGSLKGVRQFSGAAEIAWFGAAVSPADATAGIQAALDYMTGTGGGEVTCGKTGTYIFTKIVVKDNTIFSSQGATLKLKDNTLSSSSTNYTIIENRGYNGVLYKNLIVDGNRTNNTLFAGSADTIEATGQASVEGCTVLEAPDSGIFMSGVEQSRCINNTINGANDVCIYTNDSLGEGVDTQEFFISGNICIDGEFGGIALKRYISRTLVIGNIIYDCGNGVTVEDFGGGSNPNRVQVNSNYIHTIGINQPTAAKSAIVVNASQSAQIRSNFIHNVDRNGIALSGTSNCDIGANIISNCCVDGTTWSALVCTPRTASLPIAGNTIVDNKIINGTGRGIYMQNAGGFTGNSKNTVSRNTVETVGDALRVDDTFIDNSYEDNTLDSSSANDLNFNFSGVDSQTYLSNNNFVNGTTAGNLGGRLGIFNQYIGKIRVTQSDMDPGGIFLGSWNRGDISYNDTPSAGGPPGWVCVTAGSPGTWKAMASLAL